MPPGRAKLVDHARLDRIKSRDKDDGHRVCGVARRQHGRRARGQDHIGLAADQIGREAGELVDALGNSEIEDEISSLDVSELAQSAPQRFDEAWRRRSDAQQTDAIDFAGLLRACR